MDAKIIYKNIDSIVRNAVRREVDQFAFAEELTRFSGLKPAQWLQSPTDGWNQFELARHLNQVRGWNRDLSDAEFVAARNDLREHGSGLRNLRRLRRVGFSAFMEE